MGFERVAITGGSGNLGRVLAKRLSATCRVTVVDMGEPVEGLDFVQASITDYDAMKKAFEGHDAVIHLAAVSNPRVTTQETTFRVNAHGTWVVLQAAEDNGIRKVVAASSDATSGLLYNPVNYLPQYLPVDEVHPLRPIEAYSLSKEVTEAIARSYSNRGKMDVLIIRPTHIMFPDEYHLIRAKGADLNNYHVWTYVSPEDVAQGFELALNAQGIKFDSFLITAAEGLNERPTLDLVRERYGNVPLLRRPEVYEKLPTASVFDTTHAREVLGFKPTSNWRDMVATIEN